MRTAPLSPYLKSAWIVPLLICLLAGIACRSEPAQRHNILFIAVDDLNDWIGSLGGHPQISTPNIDRLAAQGILFSNAHTASPACNPSRAAVFSGRMPYTTGVWSNSSPRLPDHRPDLELLPSTFRRAGYLTLGTGKLLHGGGSEDRELYERSFFPGQRWSPLTREQVRYTPAELPTKGGPRPRHLVRLSDGSDLVLPLNGMPSDRNPDNPNGESFDWGPFDVADSAMGDSRITDWAIRQLAEASSDRPFLLAVGYYRPHIPLWAPRRDFELYPVETVKLPPTREDDLDDLSETARKWALEPVTAGSHTTVLAHGQWQAAVSAYLACITFVDRQIGRLLDALEESPRAENTIIVFWSDHGWHLGEKEHWGKWTGWERSSRVPLIVVPPRRRAGDFARGGSKSRQPVSLIDLYPTLAALAGISPPEGLEGRSLLPLMEDPELATGRVVVTSFDPGNVALRSLDWRYIRYADGSEELYHHGADPNEWNNLAEIPKHRSRLEEFRRLLPEAALQN